MVSFSCDACQNVFTKPKVERHMQSCRTPGVSCIDCGVVFDYRTIRGHTSCVTEAEKFGPKGGDACTQVYCGVCQLRLNGAVHAVQHYDSKKHRSAIRRRGARACARAPPSGKDGSGVGDKAGDGGEGKKLPGLTRVMKKALLRAKKQRLKRKRLVKAVSELLGEKAPQNLEGLVERKLRKSKRFVVRQDRVMLTGATERR